MATAMRPVIVDVDAGSDDAWALMVLLALEKKAGIRVLGITCTHGNTTIDYVCRNVLLVLESMDRADIPVFKGAESNLLCSERGKTRWHGEDGFGDGDFGHPKATVQETNAVNAIKRISVENPGLIVIALGPLTNIALALNVYPELKSSIKEMWIMGGNKDGVGNIAETSAEFNFGTDPEAAYIVVNSGISSITILPWEPCIITPFTKEWRFKTLGSTPNKHMQLMNTIDEALYSTKSSLWNPCDALLMAAFIEKRAMLKTTEVHIQVELQGTHTRGQCVLLQRWRPVNAKIIEELDYEVIREVFIEASKYNST